MGHIHKVTPLTENKHLNMYAIDATSKIGTPVHYFVSSRAESTEALKLVTGRNHPDGVVIYSLYGENFTKSSKVYVNGEKQKTTFLNNTRIDIWILR